jgi:hypothetical protein
MPSTTVWYCCECGYGPCNISIDVFCPDCQRQRCGGCKISRISNRYNYNYQLHGLAEINPYPEAFKAVNLNTNAYNLDPSPRPFNLPLEHLEGASLALTPTQIPPTCFGTGHQHSTDGPSIGDIFQHEGLINNCPVTYYCCQCKDGPKLYVNQPVCVNCNHRACSLCTS